MLPSIREEKKKDPLGIERGKEKASLNPGRGRWGLIEGRVLRSALR